MVHPLAGRPVNDADHGGGGAHDVGRLSIRVPRAQVGHGTGDCSIRVAHRGRRRGIRRTGLEGFRRSHPRRPYLLQRRRGRQDCGSLVVTTRSRPARRRARVGSERVEGVPDHHAPTLTTCDRRSVRHRVLVHLHVVRCGADPWWLQIRHARGRDLSTGGDPVRPATGRRPRHRATDWGDGHPVCLLPLSGASHLDLGTPCRGGPAEAKWQGACPRRRLCHRHPDRPGHPRRRVGGPVASRRCLRRPLQGRSGGWHTDRVDRKQLALRRHRLRDRGPHRGDGIFSHHGRAEAPCHAGSTSLSCFHWGRRR